MTAQWLFCQMGIIVFCRFAAVIIVMLSCVKLPINLFPLLENENMDYIGRWWKWNRNVHLTPSIANIHTHGLIPSLSIGRLFTTCYRCQCQCQSCSIHSIVDCQSHQGIESPGESPRLSDTADQLSHVFSHTTVLNSCGFTRNALDILIVILYI